ncbi:MAG: hypothetical protein ICV84_04420 [Flavisolibacter sp.]|nr:hypothetical protein [Flavisolibacter sp.]
MLLVFHDSLRGLAVPTTVLRRSGLLSGTWRLFLNFAVVGAAIVQRPGGIPTAYRTTRFFDS